MSNHTNANSFGNVFWNFEMHITFINCGLEQFNNAQPSLFICQCVCLVSVTLHNDCPLAKHVLSLVAISVWLKSWPNSSNNCTDCFVSGLFDNFGDRVSHVPAHV